MKNKGSKAVILVVLAVLVFSGPVLAGFGGRGRGGRTGSGFGTYGLGGYGIRSQGPGFGRGLYGGQGMRAQGPGFGRGMLGGYGMGVFCVPMGPCMSGILSLPQGPGRGMVLMGILNRLDLTDEQNEKIKDIHNANKDKMEAAKKAIAEATKALHEAVVDGADEAAIRAAGTKLGNVVSEQAVLGATTITSIKKVLTDEQLTKLKEFQEKMKERVGKFSEMMGGPAFLGGLRQQGAEGWMGSYRGRGRGMQMGRPNIDPDVRRGEGRGYQRGWETDRGKTQGWRWPEQGPPPRRR